MTHVLLTGGAGFLGQYLTAELIIQNCKVTVVDLKPALHQLVPTELSATSTHIGIDITEPDALLPFLSNVDVLFHLAGIVSFWKKHAQLLHDVNVIGTRFVLDAALKVGVQRVVHISSVAAVGYRGADSPTPELPIDETFEFPWDQVSGKHYMLSKHRSELEVQQFVEQNLDVVIANPGLMWGPGDLTNSVKLIRRIKQQKLPGCPPGGTNIIDVRDVAIGLTKMISLGRSGERYILGGENISFREVYETIASVLNVHAPQRMIPAWWKLFLKPAFSLYESFAKAPPELTADQFESSLLFRYFDNQKACDVLNWKPEISFEQMIRDSVDWLEERQLL